jgi:hypothetical protein
MSASLYRFCQTSLDLVENRCLEVVLPEGQVVQNVVVVMRVGCHPCRDAVRGILSHAGRMRREHIPSRGPLYQYGAHCSWTCALVLETCSCLRLISLGFLDSLYDCACRAKVMPYKNQPGRETPPMPRALPCRNPWPCIVSLLSGALAGRRSPCCRRSRRSLQ